MTVRAMKPRCPTTRIAIICLIASGAVRSVCAQQPAPEQADLNVGFGPTSFINVNAADAKAAFTVFARTVGRGQGYNLNVKVHTYDSERAFVSAVTNHNLHLVVILAWTYLDAHLDRYIEPSFLAIEGGHGPREYMLLVRQDSEYRDIPDLQGKQVILLESTNCEMSRQWLRTRLLERGLGSPGSFFGRVDVEGKATKVLLPVFFGNADACVLSRPVLNTMQELNPQIGRRVRAISESKPLVDAITCLSIDGWEKEFYRTDLAESVKTLHETPEGMQILTLFRVDRLAPFEATMLTETRTLKDTHDRLLKGLHDPKRNAGKEGLAP